MCYNHLMENFSNETIVAISTGASTGAISIVRMSGENSIKIADEIFKTKSGKKPSEAEPRFLMLGEAVTLSFSEQAMCVCFRSPKSYTGEDMVELQCHGGTQIASGIVKECIAHGARLATNGEFTKRAFLNGKMTLSSAEGMMDMINAESDAQIRAGYELLRGNLSKLAISVQERLTDILSEIEVSFDYPEETIEQITKAKIKEELTSLTTEIEQVLATSRTGKLISSGVNIVIVGKPNVGKSSLLNRLLQFDKAIVTDIAGTTRDTIEGTFLLDDIKINLTDTAGIHETTDKIEKIGVEKARSLTKEADIVLFLVDGSREFTEEDAEILNCIKNTSHIVIVTKSDLEQKLGKHFDNEIRVSSVTGEGIEALKEKILEITKLSNLSGSSLIITNERHRQALSDANKSLHLAIDGIDNSLDLISVDIKDAYYSIGAITGNTSSEDIIDAIFSKFCLGK